MKEYKCKKCSGKIIQFYYVNKSLGSLVNYGEQNYMCLNWGEIYRDVKIEEYKWGDRVRAYNKRKRPKHSYKGKYRLIDSDKYIFVEGGRYKEFFQARQTLPKLFSFTSDTARKLIDMYSKCVKTLNKMFGRNGVIEWKN